MRDKKQDANEQYMSNYRKWEWDIFCKLPVKYDDISLTEKYLKYWREGIQKKQKVYIAYMGVLNYSPNPHIHLLILCDTYGLFNLLEQHDLEPWSKYWDRVANLSSTAGIIKTGNIINARAVPSNPREPREMTTQYKCLSSSVRIINDGNITDAYKVLSNPTKRWEMIMPYNPDLLKIRRGCGRNERIDHTYVPPSDKILEISLA